MCQILTLSEFSLVFSSLVSGQTPKHSEVTHVFEGSVWGIPECFLVVPVVSSPFFSGCES